jgi:hypothetical protein
VFSGWDWPKMKESPEMVTTVASEFAGGLRVAVCFDVAGAGGWFGFCLGLFGVF